MRTTLSLSEARRVALGAQGFGAVSKEGAPNLLAMARRLHVLQIDSVNVLVRSHYLPLFSRLGSYPLPKLDDLVFGSRKLFETWAHEASILPIESFPLFGWAMKRREKVIEEIEQKRPGYIDSIIDEIAERGPLTASQLSDPGAKSGAWWGWGYGKLTLEWLFRTGRLGIAGRRNFERSYDLIERVIPAKVLQVPVIEEGQAKTQLLLMASKALGAGTAKDLADYFRLQLTECKPHMSDLIHSGELIEVAVDGAPKPYYMHKAVRIPGAVDAAALLSPFDPIVWERRRTEELFGMHYRIEIYTPEPKRIYGYYVLPFLMGEKLVARVDLKSDRVASKLLVRGAFAEDGEDKSKIAERLVPELTKMADWLGLSAGPAFTPRGDLGKVLANRPKPPRKPVPQRPSRTASKSR